MCYDHDNQLLDSQTYLREWKVAKCSREQHLSTMSRKYSVSNSPYHLDCPSQFSFSVNNPHLTTDKLIKLPTKPSLQQGSIITLHTSKTPERSSITHSLLLPYYSKPMSPQSHFPMSNSSQISLFHQQIH